MNISKLINQALGLFGAKIVSMAPDQRETRRLQNLHERGHWSQAKYTAGLDLNEARFLSFFEQVCAPYYEALARMPRTAAEANGGYYLDNIWFGPIDSALLYGIVRSFRPRHIIEIGSGFSTHLMRRAILDGNLAARITSIDPEPRVDIRQVTDVVCAQRVEELDAQTIVDALEAGDMLFIDSSHTITSGGDVPFLFLEVVPKLRPGVLVHVHDIFIPYDYPEEWIRTLRRGWNEQYLVHAFLAFNAAFHILWAGSYMWKNRRDALISAIPHGESATGAGSLWFQRTEA